MDVYQGGFCFVLFFFFLAIFFVCLIKYFWIFSLTFLPILSTKYSSGGNCSLTGKALGEDLGLGLCQ